MELIERFFAIAFFLVLLLRDKLSVVSQLRQMSLFRPVLSFPSP
jgi:hypothetical protein